MCVIFIDFLILYFLQVRWKQPRFADDTTLCAHNRRRNETKWRSRLENAVRWSTKIWRGWVMVSDVAGSIPQVYERLDKFPFMVSLVSLFYSKSTAEYVLERDVLPKLCITLEVRAISRYTKLRLLKTLVSPVFLRRFSDILLRMSWLEKTSNESILKKNSYIRVPVYAISEFYNYMHRELSAGR